MKIQIECAETGETFNMRMEASISKLKHQISMLVPIPPEDQVLLYGPPYKILDRVYGPDLITKDRRIFLYDRRIFLDESGIKEPTRIKLLPIDVIQPIDKLLVAGSSPHADAENVPKPLLDFESYFQQQLERGRCYEVFIEESFESCKRCIAQHQVQLDALKAAIANLEIHYNSTDESFKALEVTITEQQRQHEGLLINFERSLENLLSVPLHQSLREVMLQYYNSSTRQEGSDGHITGIAPNTGSLYDCVPVDRERAYLKQCNENYQKVEENLSRVRTVHAEIQAGVDELQPPAVDFERLSQLLDTVEHEHRSQLEVMKKLRRDYQFIYEYITLVSSPVITDATVASSSSVASRNPDSSIAADDSLAVAESAAGVTVHSDADAVMKELQRRKNSQEGGHLMELIEQRVKIVKEAKNEMERCQMGMVRSLYSTLRQIAFLQTDIRHKMRPDIEWMKRLTTGRNEYFDHLAHIAQLPTVYQQLLNEIARRRAYNIVFENEVIAASERIAQLRADETKHRERFIRSYGAHLPPIFFRLIPSLRDKPPYFHPTLTESQWLPEVQYEDLDRLSVNDINQQQHEEQQEQQQRTDSSAASSKESSRGGLPDEMSDTGVSSTPLTQTQFDRALHWAHDATATGIISSAASQTTQVSLLTSKLASDMIEGSNSGSQSQTTANGGGSVILPASMNDNSEGTRADLQEKYDKILYENTQLLRMVADLKQQLGDAKMLHESPSAATKSIATQQKDGDMTMDDAPSSYSLMHGFMYLKHVLAQNSSKARDNLRDVEAAALLPIPAQLTSLVHSQHHFVYSSLSTLQTSDEVEKQCDGVERKRSRGDSISEYLDPAIVEQQIESSDKPSVKIGDLVNDVFRETAVLVKAVETALQSPKISFVSFTAGDIALFIPAMVNNRKIWMAFSAGAPYRYLADESLNSFMARSKRGEERAYILGRIVFIDSNVVPDTVEAAAAVAHPAGSGSVASARASAAASGPQEVERACCSSNPYGLPVGTEYFVCYVEALKSLKGTTASNGSGKKTGGEKA